MNFDNWAAIWGEIWGDIWAGTPTTPPISDLCVLYPGAWDFSRTDIRFDVAAITWDMLDCGGVIVIPPPPPPPPVPFTGSPERRRQILVHFSKGRRDG